MPINLDHIEEAQRTFNEKYGVNFDLSEYDGQLRALAENFVVDTADPERDWDVQYRANFVEMMNRALVNYVDSKIEQFDPKGMLDDFEAMIMAPYRAECKRNNAYGPRKNANWSDRQFYQRVQRELGSIPNGKKEFAQQRYMAYELRVRDIRAFRNDVNAHPDALNAQKLATLMCYKEALSHAVETRSLWFRIRHPFKSSAEKRELKEVTECIKQHSNRTELAGGEQNIAAEAARIADDATISGLRQSVENELLRTAEIENADQTERLNIRELSENANQTERSSQIKEDPAPVRSSFIDL